MGSLTACRGVRVGAWQAPKTRRVRRAGARAAEGEDAPAAAPPDAPAKKSKFAAGAAAAKQQAKAKASPSATYLPKPASPFVPSPLPADFGEVKSASSAAKGAAKPKPWASLDTPPAVKPAAPAGDTPPPASPFAATPSPASPFAATPPPASPFAATPPAGGQPASPFAATAKPASPFAATPGSAASPFGDKPAPPPPAPAEDKPFWESIPRPSGAQIVIVLSFLTIISLMVGTFEVVLNAGAIRLNTD